MSGQLHGFPAPCLSPALGSSWRRDLSPRISPQPISCCQPLSQQLSAPSRLWFAPSCIAGRVCLVPARGVSSGLAHALGSPCSIPSAAEAPSGDSSSSSFLATSWGVFASKAAAQGASAVTAATSRPQLKLS